jgi:hypothetical protein
MIKKLIKKIFVEPKIPKHINFRTLEKLMWIF